MPTVQTVSPSNSEQWVYRQRPVRVELKRTDSTDKQILEDLSTGTLTNVVCSSAVLRLLNTMLEDYEDDTIGQLPAGWSYFLGTSYFSVQTHGTKTLERAAPGSAVSCSVKWNTIGMNADTEFWYDFQCPSTKGDPAVIVRGTVTGGLPTCYEWVCDMVNNVISTYKVINNVSTKITSDKAKTFTQGVWWHAHVRVIGTSLKFRCWIGSSEPGTWDVDIADSSVTQAGYLAFSGYTNAAMWWDNLLINGYGSTYQTSGNRVSAAYALASVGVVGGTWIDWTESVPANTTLTVEASVDGSTWYACTRGSPIPTILQEGANVAAVSLYLRQTLGTTNTSVTPSITNVAVAFRPVEPRSVEVVVNGVSCTLANGLLDLWGTAKVSGGAVIDWYQDVWFETLCQWWDASGANVTVTVKYKGSTISTTTFTTAEQESLWANGHYKWHALALGGIYDGPMAGHYKYFITTIEPWLCGGEFHYFIQAMPWTTFDFYYWIAHPFRVDFVGSGIVGLPIGQDVPGSGVVNGWTRSDSPASGVVQGWTRKDANASGIVGVPVCHDDVAAGIVGVPFVNEAEASGIVFQVEEVMSLEVQVIDPETAALLAALGVTFE